MIAFDRAPFDNFNGYNSYVESRGNSDQEFWDDISRSQWMAHVEAQKTGQENKVRQLLLPIARSFAAPRVISLGCGMAFDVNALLQAGIDAYGCDIGGRVGAWKDIGLPADRLFMADLTDLPLSDGQFDIAFLWHVFEHVGTEDGNQKMVSTTAAHRQKCIDEIYRILKPNGVLILGTPNRLFPLDQYHGAHTYLPEKIYSWGIKKGVGIHNPFSKKNFLPSQGQLKKYLSGFSEVEILPASSGGMFQNTSATNIPGGRFGKLLKQYISLIDRTKLSASPLSPVINLIARK